MQSSLCDCLPGCFDINYDTEVSMAPLLPRTKVQNISIVHFFYKKYHFRSQRKDELIGFTEFLCK